MSPTVRASLTEPRSGIRGRTLAARVTFLRSNGPAIASFLTDFTRFFIHITSFPLIRRTPTTPMETPTQRSSRKKMENDHDEDESDDTEEDDSDKEDEEEETAFLTHFLNYSHIIYDVVP
ncbi:hypothetical protein PGT21_035795 [Puccinia graminis f. sp. tritici]|uniref:Uncharacterized protein n=1 Tax=Puccinia graminis f. sp. tritici TaxID=56615 RepID=A0A5B0NEB6_PUCGR|nr:hypothetical protein PGT21_035795 [Puccinia graminis f. sp. tritici]